MTARISTHIYRNQNTAPKMAEMVKNFLAVLLQSIVAPVLVFLPEVSLYGIADTAILTKDIDEFSFVGVHGRLGIVVAILYVTHVVVVASGCSVNQTGGILLTGEFYDLFCVKLSPCFVKRNPYNDALEGVEGFHDFFPFFVEVVFASLRDVAVCSADKAVACPFVLCGFSDFFCACRIDSAGVVSDTRHILPYHNAFNITIIIPACGLYLDVFANHVETKIFGLDDIKSQCLVSRSCVKSVGPPALIQWANLEE